MQSVRFPMLVIFLAVLAGGCGQSSSDDTSDRSSKQKAPKQEGDKEPAQDVTKVADLEQRKPEMGSSAT